MEESGMDKTTKKFVLAISIMMIIALTIGVFNMVKDTEIDKDTFSEMGIIVVDNGDILNLTFKEAGNYSIEITSKHLGSVKGYDIAHYASPNSCKEFNLESLYDDITIKIKNMRTGYFESHMLEVSK